MYSFGSEIAALLQEHMFDYMDAPIKRVAAEDVPLPYSKEIELLALPERAKGRGCGQGDCLNGARSQAHDGWFAD